MSAESYICGDFVVIFVFNRSNLAAVYGFPVKCTLYPQKQINGACHLLLSEWIENKYVQWPGSRCEHTVDSNMVLMSFTHRSRGPEWGLTG